MSGKRRISLMSWLVSFLIIVKHAYVLEANRQEYNLIVAGIQMNNSAFLWVIWLFSFGFWVVFEFYLKWLYFLSLQS